MCLWIYPRYYIDKLVQYTSEYKIPKVGEIKFEITMLSLQYCFTPFLYNWGNVLFPSWMAEIPTAAMRLYYNKNNFWNPIFFSLKNLAKLSDWLRLLTAKLNAAEPFEKINFYNNTGLSKKMDGIWNRYNLKSTGRIYTFGILKCSEKFKVLDLP